MTSEEFIARKAPRWYVVLFRLFMACYFILIGLHGVLEWKTNSAVFTERYDKLAAPGTQTPWFRTYLGTAIDRIKDKRVFTWLLLAAPLLLGLSLLLGLWTRLSTLLGLLWVLNLYLIKFLPAWDVVMAKKSAYAFEPLVHVVELAALVLLFFAGAGRTFGLDGIFWRKRVWAKLEPAAPGPVKAPATTAPRGQFIPLSKTGSGRIEDTVGDFASPGPKKPAGPTPGTAAPPAGGTPKPQQPSAPKGPGQ